MLARSAIAAAILIIGTAASAQEHGIPDGPGKDKVVAACAGCHEISRVSIERRTKAHWQQTVDDMIARGAPVDDDADYDVVVAYLAKNFSPPVTAPVGEP